MAEHRAVKSISLRCEFAQEQPIRHWLDNRDGELQGIEYQQQVLINVGIPVDQMDDWDAFCQSLGLAELQG